MNRNFLYFLSIFQYFNCTFHLITIFFFSPAKNVYFKFLIFPDFIIKYDFNFSQSLDRV